MNISLARRSLGARELPSQLPDSTTVLRSAAALLKQFARFHPPTPPFPWLSLLLHLLLFLQQLPPQPERVRADRQPRLRFLRLPVPAPGPFHHRLPRGVSDYYHDGTRDSRRTKLLLVTMVLVKGLWSWGKRLGLDGAPTTRSVIFADFKFEVLSGCTVVNSQTLPIGTLLIFIHVKRNVISFFFLVGSELNTSQCGRESSR